jgi:chlorobactene glucosyltransferase
MIDALALLPVAVAAATTAVNLASWPTLREHLDGPWPSVSVLIPARDEERHIGQAVRAALADARVAEVLVADDGSVDATPQILRELVALDSRVRVFRPGQLPAGWIGKPHACEALGREAVGDVLLFIDADVTLEEGGISRLLEAMRRARADVLTAVPAQELGSAAERLMLPLLYLTYTAWLPNVLVGKVQNPRVLAANGQVLAMRREAWRSVGGFASVRAEIVDDMAICRRAKEKGLTVVFADGRRVARCRMYEDFDGIIAGFSKNLYEGLGSGPAVLAAMALYLAAFVLPYAMGLLAVLGASSLGPAALVGVGLNVAMRSALALRWRHPLWSVLAHPVAVLLLIGVAFNSWRWHRAGRVGWRGRTYATRAERATA